MRRWLHRGFGLGGFEAWVQCLAGLEIKSFWIGGFGAEDLG